MAQTRILRGADLQVYINGQLFAVGIGLRWQADPGRHAIMGIDQYTPFELAPGQSVIKGTIDCIRLRQDGGLEGRGVSAPQDLVMLEKYFSIAVVDRSTDTVILAIEQAALSNQSWSVAAKGDLSGNFGFEGMGWYNEASQ